MANESLKIDHVEFMVTSHIERAPQWTMIRELTMNAVEAAMKAPLEKRQVRWTTGSYNGVRKAVIWNTGPGMDREELKSSTNLACQIDKKLGLDDNFGMGAKISSLASNKFGLRYRSCKNKVVHEVTLCFDEVRNEYVRLEHEINGTLDTVLDVTAAAEKDYKLNEDWTEVMLLGNDPEQDTASLPLKEAKTKTYVADSLYRRFYRLPETLDLRLHEVYQRFDKERKFTAIGQRYNMFQRSETIICPEHNLKIHFLHDPENPSEKDSHRLSRRGALSSTTTTCCLIHKNEMYDVKTGHAWSAIAPQFGIAFGSKELCVHIELENDIARPSQYRERLISKESSIDIKVEEYAAIVRENTPEWVREVIKNASPKQTQDLSNVENELQKILDNYNTIRNSKNFDPVNGKDMAEAVDFDNSYDLSVASNNTYPKTANAIPRKKIHETPEGALATSKYVTSNKAPKIIMITTPDVVSERGLNGRAAEYIKETNELFINGLYEAIDRTFCELEPEFINDNDQESTRAIILEQARIAMSFRVGKTVVFAMAKRNNKEWNDDSMALATTKESLSMAADNYHENMTLVRKSVKEAIKIKQVKAA